MSGQDWPVGTVATATVRGVEGVRVIRGHTFWWMPDPDLSVGGRHLDLEEATDVRPLVVLDPDDSPQVGDFTRCVVAQIRQRVGEQTPAEHTFADAIAAALRDQMKPPRIPEPKGLGAVVEDSEHRRWIRRSNEPGEFPWDLASDREASGFGWSQIDAVRVLSEGVSE